MGTNVVIVGNGDDWEGLYIHGRLFLQGHRLTAEDILEAFHINYESKLTAEGWLEEVGHLPTHIKDVVFDD